jgi:hypothetical protein
MPVAARALYYCTIRPPDHAESGGFTGSRFGQIETSMAMDAYLLSFSANSLGAQHTNTKFGMYVLMCNTNVCVLNLVS